MDDKIDTSAAGRVTEYLDTLKSASGIDREEIHTITAAHGKKTLSSSDLRAMLSERDALRAEVEELIDAGGEWATISQKNRMLSEDAKTECATLRAEVDRLRAKYPENWITAQEHYKARAEKAEAERDALSAVVTQLTNSCVEWSEVSQENYQRAKVAESKIDALRAEVEQLKRLLGDSREWNWIDFQEDKERAVGIGFLARLDAEITEALKGGNE